MVCELQSECSGYRESTKFSKGYIGDIRNIVQIPLIDVLVIKAIGSSA
jgi:hypothetical protein